MAKSLDKERINNTVNDDMIKDALKLGLSSIKASDYLINQTLLKCQDEITKEKQDKKRKLFTPWVYKLGAPLAVGAFALVLLINTSGLRMKNSMASDVAPQASSDVMFGSQAHVGGAASKEKENGEVQLNAASTESASPDMDSGIETRFNEEILKFDDDIKATCRANISVLNSLDNRAPNSKDDIKAVSEQSFNVIADLYNETKETQLILVEEAITRINSLVKTGVDTQMLLRAQDYYEILSDEGYWALPLMNGNGDIEKILAVSTFDSGNPDAAITSQDIIYTIGEVQYIVTEFTDSIYIGSELKELLDINAVRDIIKKSGYTCESDIIIADINYGKDFVALFNSGKQKFVIPFMINNSTFGLENKKVYAWTDFTQVASQSMKQ